MPEEVLRDELEAVTAGVSEEVLRDELRALVAAAAVLLLLVAAFTPEVKHSSVKVSKMSIVLLGG